MASGRGSPERMKWRNPPEKSRVTGYSTMPLTLQRVNCLHKLWGSQSWLQSAFSRRSRGTNTPRRPEKPPKRRLRARLPAPQFVQNCRPEAK
jgi:hypothetical protein